MQSILFFKIGAIGDVLMTTPLVRQTKEAKAKVGYLVGKRSAVVLQGNKTIDELATFNEEIFEKKSVKNVFLMIGLIYKLRQLRTHFWYKTIVVLDRHRIFWLLAKLAGFKKRVGLDRLGIEGKYLTHKLYRDKEGREVEHYLSLGEYLGFRPNLDDQEYEYKNVVSEKVNHAFTELRFQWHKKIGIALGGGNQISKSIHGGADCRRWPLEKWEALITRLLDAGYDVVAFGGPTDRKLQITRAGYHDLTGKFSLKETISAIAKMDLLICQESWFMHFGAVAGVPVIALAGPTNPERLYPYKTRTEKYPGERIRKMSFECYDAYGSYDKCTGDEMNAISVDEVYAKTLPYLS